MLGCFNPILGQIWTNSNNGLKMSFKNVTKWLGLSIFDPKIGLKQPTFFFLQCIISACLLSKKQKLYINEHQDKNSHVPVKVKNPRKKKDE